MKMSNRKKNVFSFLTRRGLNYKKKMKQKQIKTQQKQN